MVLCVVCVRLHAFVCCVLCWCVLVLRFACAHRKVKLFSTSTHNKRHPTAHTHKVKRRHNDDTDTTKTTSHPPHTTLIRTQNTWRRVWRGEKKKKGADSVCPFERIHKTQQSIHHLHLHLHPQHCHTHSTSLASSKLQIYAGHLPSQ